MLGWLKFKWCGTRQKFLRYWQEKSRHNSNRDDDSCDEDDLQSEASTPSFKGTVGKKRCKRSSVSDDHTQSVKHNAPQHDDTDRRDRPCDIQDTRQSGTMFVSEANLFTNQLLKLYVISSGGAVWCAELDTETTVNHLKIMAVEHFGTEVDDVDKATCSYKLVLVSDARTLRDLNTILQEGIRENDELLLVPRRLGPVAPPPLPAVVDGQPFLPVRTPPDTVMLPSLSGNLDVGELRAPTESDVAAATQSAESRNERRPSCGGDVSHDFQMEIRKILISLVEASALILDANAEAIAVFRQTMERLQQKSHPSRVDPSLVRQLVDMGFPESRATKALRSKNMNPQEALEWLLENASEPDPEASAALSPSASVPPAFPSDTLTPEVVSSLVAQLSAVRKRDFRPSTRALVGLREMGFGDAEIMDALRVAGNNQDAACEWLLGDRVPGPDDVDRGLDRDGPIYKAIMANPVIRLGMGSPKVLSALVSMLEHPNNANVWLNDPDTSPVLSQIFKTYHAEKHSVTSISQQAARQAVLRNLRASHPV